MFENYENKTEEIKEIAEIVTVNFDINNDFSVPSSEKNVENNENLENKSNYVEADDSRISSRMSDYLRYLDAA